MGSNTDETKGRAKEAMGALTGDKDMKREGKVDQGKASVKDAVDDIGDSLSDAMSGDDKGGDSRH